MTNYKPTVKFSINLREDAANWVRVGQKKRMTYGRSLADFTAEIPKPVLRGIRSRSRGRAIVYVHRYLRGRRPLFQVDLEAMKVFLEQYIGKYGAGLFNEISKLTGKPLYRKTFYATFTLLSTCPYNPDRHWFMISAKRNMAKQVNTIAHEIFHLQFIHYYYEHCRRQGLSESQFQDLKEALTVLLNEPRFDKYHLGLDVGYSAHQQLRRDILRLWRKKTAYKVFLDGCISATKRDAPLLKAATIH